MRLYKPHPPLTLPQNNSEEMALHFSSERPEDQFYTDFGNLNKFGEDVSLI